MDIFGCAAAATDRGQGQCLYLHTSGDKSRTPAASSPSSSVAASKALFNSRALQSIVIRGSQINETIPQEQTRVRWLLWVALGMVEDVRCFFVGVV